MSSLSGEQEKVLDRALLGENLFITGAAGTGKSFLTRTIISELQRKHNGRGLILSPTGIAAYNIGGSTIHSAFELGMGTDSGKYISKKSRFLEARLKKVKFLVIDEISMVSASMLACIDDVLKSVHRRVKPFAGLQVIVVGDFFQLPPIEKDYKFAFESELWTSFTPVVLKENHRQNDKIFLEVLNQIRVGKVDKDSVQLITSLFRTPPFELIILTSLRDYAAKRNEEGLAQIQSPLITNIAVTRGNHFSIETIFKNTNIQRNFSFKLGAIVMLTKNTCVDRGLCNGTRGIVTGVSLHNHPVVTFENGEVETITPVEFKYPLDDHAAITLLGFVSQYPLAHGWAITIHKSQGMTFNGVELDMRRIFEVGQAYVAFSRVKTLEGLKVTGFEAKTVIASPRVLEYYQSINI